MEAEGLPPPVTVTTVVTNAPSTEVTTGDEMTVGGGGVDVTPLVEVDEGVVEVAVVEEDV